MTYKYRYLPKRYILISFMLILSSLLVISVGCWVGIISYLSNGKMLTGIRIFFTIAIIFLAIGPLFFLNERLIKMKCVWDEVTMDGFELVSKKLGVIDLKEVKKIKVNDLSKVYSFMIITRNARFKFSCLSFFGSEGGSEYQEDKEALKSIADKMISLASKPENDIKVGSESNSDVLFYLSCLAMILLIPGFFYAPQRMIFVAPFVVPIFIILCVKRKNEMQG